MGLPHGRKLTRKDQFDRVLKERLVSLRRSSFRVYATTSLDGTVDGRLGLIVGKRHAKRAVERNKIKRVLRESFRKQTCRMSGVDIVVQLIEPAHADTLTTDANELWLHLCNALGKNHVAHKAP